MSKRNNLVAYVAGDENILLPAVVTLASLRKFNPEVDTYLFIEFEQTSINEEVAKLLSSNKITLVDIKELKEKNINFNIDSFNRFGRWPIHVFYNYLVPNYLHELGYKYAIKLDYDVLCIGKYDLNELFPDDDEIIAICLRGRLVDFIDKENEAKLAKTIKLKDYKTVNAGFICMNLTSYVNKAFFEEFKRAYQLLQNIKIKEYVEQFAIGVLQAKYDHEFKNLSLKYNYRPSYKFPNAVINVHYNLLEKPWIKYKINDLSSECFKSFLLNNLWIEEAEEIGLKSFIQKQKYSVLNFCKSFDNIEPKNSNLLFLHKYALLIAQSKIPNANEIIFEFNKAQSLTFYFKEVNSIKYRISFYGTEFFRVKVELLLNKDNDYKKLFEVYSHFNAIEANPSELTFYINVRHKQELSKIVSAFREIYKLSNLII